MDFAVRQEKLRTLKNNGTTTTLAILLYSARDDLLVHPIPRSCYQPFAGDTNIALMHQSPTFSIESERTSKACSFYSLRHSPSTAHRISIFEALLQTQLSNARVAFL